MKFNTGIRGGEFFDTSMYDRVVDFLNQSQQGDYLCNIQGWDKTTRAGKMMCRLDTNIDTLTFIAIYDNDDPNTAACVQNIAITDLVGTNIVTGIARNTQYKNTVRIDTVYPSEGNNLGDGPDSDNYQKWTTNLRIETATVTITPAVALLGRIIIDYHPVYNGTNQPYNHINTVIMTNTGLGLNDIGKSTNTGTVKASDINKLITAVKNIRPRSYIWMVWDDTNSYVKMTRDNPLNDTSTKLSDTNNGYLSFNSVDVDIVKNLTEIGCNYYEGTTEEAKKKLFGSCRGTQGQLITSALTGNEAIYSLQNLKVIQSPVGDSYNEETLFLNYKKYDQTNPRFDTDPDVPGCWYMYQDYSNIDLKTLVSGSYGLSRVTGDPIPVFLLYELNRFFTSYLAKNICPTLRVSWQSGVLKEVPFFFHPQTRPNLISQSWFDSFYYNYNNITLRFKGIDRYQKLPAL